MYVRRIFRKMEDLEASINIGKLYSGRMLMIQLCSIYRFKQLYTGKKEEAAYHTSSSERIFFEPLLEQTIDPVCYAQVMRGAVNDMKHIENEGEITHYRFYPAHLYVTRLQNQVFGERGKKKVYTGLRTEVLKGIQMRSVEPEFTENCSTRLHFILSRCPHVWFEQEGGCVLGMNDNIMASFKTPEDRALPYVWLDVGEEGSVSLKDCRWPWVFLMVDVWRVDTQVLSQTALKEKSKLGQYSIAPSAASPVWMGRTMGTGIGIVVLERAKEGSRLDLITAQQGKEFFVLLTHEEKNPKLFLNRSHGLPDQKARIEPVVWFKHNKELEDIELLSSSSTSEASENEEW